MVTGRSQARARARPDRAANRPLVNRVAGSVGGLFLVIGVLGFVPGVTTGYDSLELAGHHSGARLFGAFAVSVLLNLLHIAFGVAGVALARSAAGAPAFLIGGGAVYLVLWLYGLAVETGAAADVIPVNRADDRLHLGLGVGMILLGILTTRMPGRDR